MHGVVLADDSGCAIRPAILWADSRATDEVAAYRRLPARVTRTLMNPLTPGMAGPMPLWLAAHEPGHYADATWALQPKDWLRLRLTGLAASDPSDASATLLYDVPADRWHVELIDALGLDNSLLPDLASSAGSPVDTGGRRCTRLGERNSGRYRRGRHRGRHRRERA